MDTSTAQEILKWVIVGVAINAITALFSMAGLTALTFHITRATREIATAVRDVAAMTRDVATMTQEVLRRMR